MSHIFRVSGAAILILLFSGLSANAAPEVRKTVNIMTISEATLSTIALISQRFEKRIPEFSWSVEFGERQWVAHLKGNVNSKESNITITGYLWGEDGQTLSVNYSGLGTAGGEPVQINGTAEWEFNKEASDYQAMNFRQVTKIGQKSFWGWVVGAEVIAGGVVGAGAAVAGSAAATGGIALGLAPWIGAGGAMVGAGTALTISNATKSLLSSDGQTAPPPPPPAPPRPRLPDVDKLSPQPGKIIIALEKGTITGSAIDGVHILTGDYSLEKGYGSGSIRALRQ